MRILLLFFWPAVLCILDAQPAPFPGVVRGVLVECDAQGDSGELALLTRGIRVFRFRFDAKTYMEREGARITSRDLQKGDTIEVVSDRDGEAAVHYARTVHAVSAHQVGSRSRRMAPPAADPIELLAPRGNLELAGVVASRTAARIVLHTRREGEKSILLRVDTRYLDGGIPVGAADLQPNTRVFIRAGRNFEDQIEAYQIIWGEILEPAPR